MALSICMITSSKCGLYVYILLYMLGRTEDDDGCVEMCLSMTMVLQGCALKMAMDTWGCMYNVPKNPPNLDFF